LLAAVQHVEQLVAADPQGLGRGVEVEPVTRLVLHLGHQDRFAAQAGCAGDPVALGLHADDLGVCVLGDLADQRLAVSLGHPVARLDPLVGVDQLLEGPDRGQLRCAHTPQSSCSYDRVHPLSL